MWQTSYEASWSWYVRGNVVTQHAKKLIVQFMAASCGKLNRHDDNDSPDEERSKVPRLMPSSHIPSDRVHVLLDRMFSDDSRKQKLAQVRGENDDSEDDNRKADRHALSQSNQVNDAMQMSRLVVAKFPPLSIVNYQF